MTFMNGFARALKTPAARLARTTLAVALVAAAPTWAGDDDPLASLRALEGNWHAVADGDMVKQGDLVSSFRVTASGHAVVETNFPGTPHEMLTVYTRDGDDLVLTHYCMSGNQPRMRATSPSGPKIEFAFEGGDNIADPARDRHMHSAWLEIVGPDELRSQWTEHADGEPVLVVGMHTRRAAEANAEDKGKDHDSAQGESR